MKAILSSVLLICLVPLISVAEKTTDLVAADKVRSFLGLQAGTRYVYKGVLKHPSYIVKTNGRYTDIDKSNQTTEVEATVAIGPSEDGSYVTRGLDVSKSLVIETESDPVIKYRTLDSRNDIIAESLMPLQSTFVIAAPRKAANEKVMELVETGNSIKITQTGETEDILVITKNSDGSVNIQSSSKARHWGAWGPKTSSVNQHNTNFSLSELTPISPK